MLAISANTVSVTKIVDAFRDKDRNGMLLFLLYLNQTTDISQRKWYREFFNTLVDDTGIAPVDIVDVVHLGTKVACPLQFKFLSYRRSVLGNAT